jgi:hypothetical protein
MAWPSVVRKREVGRRCARFAKSGRSDREVNLSKLSTKQAHIFTFFFSEDIAKAAQAKSEVGCKHKII